MEAEVWKSITGYNGYYEVSNLGNVRSVTRKIERTNPKNPNKKSSYTYHGKQIPFWVTKKGGYHRCTLNINGKKKNHLTHRLVATEFISNSDNKEQINHIDCIKTNNNVNNLEWCTNKENREHAINNKLFHWQI